MKDYIGQYVKRFESGGLTCFAFGHSGRDGGLSCGTNQRILRYGVAIDFLKKYFPNNKLVKKIYFNHDMPDIPTDKWAGAEYYSSPDEVKAAWLSCIEEVGKEKFEQYEYEDIRENYYEVAKKELQGFLDVDSNRAFQEMVFAGSIFCGAVAYANRIKNILHTYQNNEQFFDAIYNTLYKEYPWERWADAVHVSYLPNSERETLRPLLKVAALKEEIVMEIKEFKADSRVYRDRNINGAVGSLKDVKAIVHHYTGVCGQTARGNAEYFGTLASHANDPLLSIHFAVDDTEVWSCVPMDKRAGHCDDAGIGQFKGVYMNENTIGIEVCPHHTSGKKYPGAYEKGWYFSDTSIELLKQLDVYIINEIRKAGGQTPALVRHYDITGKHCPAPWLENEQQWENFKADVMNRVNLTMTAFSYCDSTVTVIADRIEVYKDASMMNVCGYYSVGTKVRAVQSYTLSDNRKGLRTEGGLYIGAIKGVEVTKNNMKKRVVQVNSPNGKLTLRNFPSSYEGDKIREFTNGNCLQVIGECYNRGDHWYLVDQGNAKEKFSGFVAARYVK